MSDNTGKYFLMKISKFDEKILEVFSTQFERHFTEGVIRGAYRQLRSFDNLLIAIGMSLKLNLSLSVVAEMMNTEME